MNLWTIPSPTMLLKEGYLKLAAQDHFPTLFKYLKERIIHNPGNLC